MSDGPDDAAKARWTAGRRLAGYAALGLPLAALDGGTGLGLAAAATLDAALLAGSAIESRVLLRRAPHIERSLPSQLLVGAQNEVVLRLHNTSARALRLTIRDDLPPGWEATPEEQSVHLPPHARRELRYEVRPPRRGRFEFGDLHLRLDGVSGLGSSTLTVSARQEVRVYPNVLGPKRYQLSARLGDLRHAGFRSVRASGGGGEFDHLREYVPGDSYRSLDWKGTAKRRRPITRVFEQERSQQVILCVDAGRMMATRVGSLSKLDHAINAALLLAWVALSKGDRVGLVVFADVVRGYVPPGRGQSHYRRLLEALYEVHAEPTSVDFRGLVQFLRLKVPRRSLLLLFSDLLDEAHAMPLAEHAAILRRRHLPVCITMADPVIASMADAPSESAEEVYARAAAADVLIEREGVKLHLEKSAVGMVEASAAELAVATVNRYLEIKARHEL